MYVLTLVTHSLSLLLVASHVGSGQGSAGSSVLSVFRSLGFITRVKHHLFINSFPTLALHTERESELCPILNRRF